MSKFLVTGGAGFIGSHIAARLVESNHEVRILDNFSSGKMENIFGIKDKIDLIKDDIRNFNIVKKAVEGIDYVLHQAALRSVPKSLNNPHEYNEVNIDGILNLLKASLDGGVKRFVFASSSSIYGEAVSFPEKENDLPRLISPYALTKLAGEYYCRIFSQNYGLETVSLRYFNVFGPRQAIDDEYSVVIPKFISCMLDDESPPVDGTGKQTRDFTFVDNVVDANILAATKEAVKCEVLNVGCGKNKSILELVDALNKIMHKSIKPVFRESRRGDVFKTLAEISRVKKIIDYKPKVDFEEGLKKDNIMVSKTKAVVITGGAGFIGSHLSERLIEKGLRIICVDNLITGHIENISKILNNKKFEFIRHDVSKPIKIKGNVNFILHFASPASPEDYLKYPIPTLKVGSLGTHNVLGLAKAKRAKFLLASTSEVYGDPLVHPQCETYWGNVNPIGPRGVYDEAKRFAEAITMAYHRYHKIDTRILRIFNTYGPRMRNDDGRAIPNFITQALENKPLTVYGKGLQTRSFCYIDDLVNGIMRLMNSSVHQPINLGNPNEMSIIKLAKAIIKLSKGKSKIIYKSLPQDDPKRRQPDISQAKRLLRWQPKIDLIEGLNATIQWFKK